MKTRPSAGSPCRMMLAPNGSDSLRKLISSRCLNLEDQSLKRWQLSMNALRSAYSFSCWACTCIRGEVIRYVYIIRIYSANSATLRSAKFPYKLHVGVPIESCFLFCFFIDGEKKSLKYWISFWLRSCNFECNGQTDIPMITSAKVWNRLL